LKEIGWVPDMFVLPEMLADAWPETPEIYIETLPETPDPSFDSMALVP